MSGLNVVAIFDFDKTLITEDSFRLFSLRAATTVRNKALIIILALLCKLGLIDNSTYKARVLERVWSNKKHEEKKEFLRYFLSKLHLIENSSVVMLLKQHLTNADKVIIISASPEFYLVPFVQSWSKDILVFGTKVHSHDMGLGVDNLYGPSKAILAESLIQQYKPTSVLVYTDHISDLSLIKLATDVRLVSPSPQCIRMLKKLDIKFETVCL